MAILTSSGRIGIARSVKKQQMFLAWGTGSEDWGATPPTDGLLESTELVVRPAKRRWLRPLKFSLNVQRWTLFVSCCCRVGDRPTWESVASTHYQVLGSEVVTRGLSVGQRVRRAGMRKREVIEFRKPYIKLKPIQLPMEQAVFFKSIEARFGRFNRNLRAWRVLHNATTKQERSCVFRGIGTKGESVQGGSDRMEHRKSDESVVVKKGMKMFRAKGLELYRVIWELLSQIKGWK